MFQWWLHLLGGLLQRRGHLGGTCLPELWVASDGFHMSNRRSRAIHVRWDDIDQIVTWKEDVMVYDDIWLGFHRRSTEDWVRIGEQQSNFMNVAIEMRRHFPAIAEGWYFEVMEPVFERKFTVLYHEQPKPRPLS